MFSPTTLAEPTLAATFGVIVRDLIHTVALKLNRNPKLNPLLLLLHRQLTRHVRLLAALHQAFRAGTLAPPRRRRRPAPQPDQPDIPRPKAPPRPHLPGGAWLVPLVRETACYRSQLEHLLLHDPEAHAFLAAAPQAGRLLRPLCRMLGLRPPPYLRAPPRPKPALARKASAADPADPKAPIPRRRTRRRRPPSPTALLRAVSPSAGKATRRRSVRRRSAPS